MVRRGIAVLRRRASGLLALVVLRGALDRRYPALAPLHPDLVFGLQLEGRLIETSDPDLDERVAAIGRVKEPRPTAGAEAATVIARDLAAHLERLDGPMRIHSERTARFFSATRAVATHDMHRVTANAVADRAAETSAGAYSCLHARRCYATLLWASVRDVTRPPWAIASWRSGDGCCFSRPAGVVSRSNPLPKEGPHDHHQPAP